MCVFNQHLVHRQRQTWNIEVKFSILSSRMQFAKHLNTLVHLSLKCAFIFVQMQCEPVVLINVHAQKPKSSSLQTRRVITALIKIGKVHF